MNMKTLFNWRSMSNVGRNGAFRDDDFSPTKNTSIWETCPQLAGLDPAVGFQFFDDFISQPVDDTTGNPCAYLFSSDTATGGITFPKVAGGVMQLATGGVDNNETYLQLGAYGGATSAPFVIEAANSKPLWYSCYAKAVQHADMGVFIGLAEENSAAANFLTDNSGVIADKDFVGFNLLTASPTAWNCTWKKSGQAVQAVTNQATNADDFHLFEFVYDGVATITFYIDRTAVSTTALATATTFPSAERLAPIFAVKTGEAVAKSIQIDYVKVFQVR